MQLKAFSLSKDKRNRLALLNNKIHSDFAKINCKGTVLFTAVFIYTTSPGFANYNLR